MVQSGVKRGHASAYLELRRVNWTVPADQTIPAHALMQLKRAMRW